MVDICRILTQDPPSVAPTKAEGDSGRRVERTSASKVITIDGQDLAQELLSTRIVSVVAEESARGLSWAEIVIQNDRLKFTDVELIRGAGLNVEVFTGYGNTRLVSRGKFRRMVSSSSPAARCPSTMWTGMRVPLTHGSPPQMRGSVLMRSFKARSSLAFAR